MQQQMDIAMLEVREHHRRARANDGATSSGTSGGATSSSDGATPPLLVTLQPAVTQEERLVYEACRFNFAERFYFNLEELQHINMEQRYEGNNLTLRRIADRRLDDLRVSELTRMENFSVERIRNIVDMRHRQLRRMDCVMTVIDV